MRSLSVLLLIFVVTLTASCGSDEKDDFSGVGKLIADRNKMRYNIAEKSDNSETTAGPDQKAGTKPERVAGTNSQDKIPETVALEKRKIVIVDASSGTSLGQGVAFVNKKGEIVRIKLAD